MIRLRFVVIPAALLALRLSAQLGFGPGDGLRLRARLVGEKWGDLVANGKDRLQVGRVGSGRPIDGLSVRHITAPIRLQVKTAEGWLPWVEPGAETGIAGSPILGLRIKSETRALRYRGSFVGKGAGDWVRDGEAIEGGTPLEALDLELLEGVPADAVADFEYRVFFAGSGFTPWKKAGEAAESADPKAMATAFQIRGADIRTEVLLEPGGWQPTVLPDQVAGDPSGKRAISGLRLFGGTLSLRYRVRTEEGWGNWQGVGTEAKAGSTGRSVSAIELDLKRAR